MTEYELDSIWNRVHFTFGLTPPKDGRRSLCAQRCRDAIDSRAVEYIKSEIDALDQKPRNVAGFFLAKYGEWRAAHPERREAGAPCPYCWMGSGFIYAYRNDDRECRFRCSVPCGHCRPAANGAMTVYALQERGYWIERPKTAEEVFRSITEESVMRRMDAKYPELAAKVFGGGMAV